MQCLNAVYGTIVAALRYNKKFVKSLTKQWYKINPYDECIASKVISHESSKVIDDTMSCQGTKSLLLSVS